MMMEIVGNMVENVVFNLLELKEEMKQRMEAGKVAILMQKIDVVSSTSSSNDGDVFDGLNIDVLKTPEKIMEKYGVEFPNYPIVESTDDYGLVWWTDVSKLDQDEIMKFKIILIAINNVKDGSTAETTWLRQWHKWVERNGQCDPI